MAKKVKLIVNPNADLGRAWHAAANLRPVIEEFGGADWAGTVYPTHAVELARQAAEEGYELVIAAGGDGTVHEVANGLMAVPAEHRPLMGVVPLGSGNDFSHATGMDDRPTYALRQVLEGKPRRVDVGRLMVEGRSDEYFVNGLGIGFDTTVTIHSRKFTWLRGFPVYLMAVIKTILLNHDAPLMKVETDREMWSDETLMMVLCNGPREGGGFWVAPEAKLDDGIFHYAQIRKVSRPMMFRLLPEVMKGTHGRFKQVRMGQFTELSLQSDRPLYIHTDGEVYAGFGVDIRSIRVELLPDELGVCG
ncbi:diacylglycerol/lipid kinase family protein [Chloroflexota bacterium]